jgi:hypothetical protein
MENPQAFARGILENTNNDMSFNESGDVCGNTRGLAFIDRMEAQVRKLSEENKKLGKKIEEYSAKLGKKIEESSAELRKEAAVTTRKMIEEYSAKLGKKIEESSAELRKEAAVTTRKLREEIERNTDIVENIRGERKKIRERIYYVYERDVPKASGSKVISNEKAAAQEDRAFMGAFHFSSETGRERQAKDNDQKEQIFSERPSGKRAGRT